jgi:hypothetical protein
MSLLLLSGCQSVSYVDAPTSAPETQSHSMNSTHHSAPGEYLLTLKPELTEDRQTAVKIQQELSSVPITSVSAIGHHLYLIKVSPDPGLAAIQRAVSNTVSISAVQPNFNYDTHPPKTQLFPQ